jgi:hypothetical protein
VTDCNSTWEHPIDLRPHLYKSYKILVWYSWENGDDAGLINQASERAKYFFAWNSLSWECQEFYEDVTKDAKKQSLFALSYRWLSSFECHHSFCNFKMIGSPAAASGRRLHSEADVWPWWDRPIVEACGNLQFYFCQPEDSRKCCTLLLGGNASGDYK